MLAKGDGPELCYRRPREATAVFVVTSLMRHFSKQMSILEALESHSEARDVFARWGMGCCLCIGAQLESIESGAIMHAVDPDEIVAELNLLTDPAAPD